MALRTVAAKTDKILAFDHWVLILKDVSTVYVFVSYTHTSSPQFQELSTVVQSELFSPERQALSCSMYMYHV